MEFRFPGLEEAQLIKMGAEANLYRGLWHGRSVVVKWRIPKRYRVPKLDSEIRARRTIREAQIIHEAKEAGVPTPTIFLVDVAGSSLVMEYVVGVQVKQVLDEMKPEERRRLCRHIGVLIGRLHKAGIVHGDLTTSNMIITPRGQVVFIDFGLSERSTELEPRGVDLHLLRRVLISTHHRHAEESFRAVMEGYASVMGEEEKSKVLSKIREIERRGRYVSER